MSWMEGPSGTFALVSYEQWHEMADAIDDGDLDRTRELLQSWRPWMWPTPAELADDRP